MSLNRRQALFAGAALPLVAAGGVAVPTAAPAQEAAPDQPMMPFPLQSRFQIGEMRFHTLLAGTAPNDDPHGIYGVNVDDAAFAALSEANFVSPDFAQMFFQPTLIDTGDARVLFDTGLAAGGLLAALEAAGYAPEDVTHVVLTHHHGDHIGGLTDGAGAATFPGAQLITGQAEWDFWSSQENEGFETHLRPFEGSITLIEPGAEIVPGIAAVEAYGHTPGHLAFTAQSGDATLLLAADAMHHFVYALVDPSWQVGFDSDPEMASETRRRLLEMAAESRMPVVGYHLPAPGLGFIEAREDGTFRWVPHSYQYLPPQA